MNFLSVTYPNRESFAANLASNFDWLVTHHHAWEFLYNLFRCKLFLEKPAVDTRTSFSDKFGKLADRHRTSSVLYPVIICPVVALSIPTGPTAIFWRIGSRWINAIQACSCWTSSHISKEIIEGVSPGITDYNSFSPIVFVERTFGIVAAILQLDPYAICRAVALPVFCHSDSPYLTSKTATAFGSAAN